MLTVLEECYWPGSSRSNHVFERSSNGFPDICVSFRPACCQSVSFAMVGILIAKASALGGQLCEAYNILLQCRSTIFWRSKTSERPMDTPVDEPLTGFSKDAYCTWVFRLWGWLHRGKVLRVSNPLLASLNLGLEEGLKTKHIGFEGSMGRLA